jgi:hypothetical protein
MIESQQFSRERYRAMTAGSTGTFLRPLEPDIIGEMYVLEHLCSENPSRGVIAEIAWVMAGDRMQAFYCGP